jgi:hypothetical protein
MKIIEIMKDSLTNKAFVNVGNHEEEFYPLPTNENRTQIPVHVQKEKPFNSSKTPLTMTKNANSYEA